MKVFNSITKIQPSVTEEAYFPTQQAVETPLVAQVHSPETRAEWGRRVPMKRYGSPEEMAGAAVFLLSDEATYVTGHVLTVDGGFVAQGLAAPIAAE